MKDELENELEIIAEDTTTPNAPNIATTDENISVDLMFQQSQLPSLGRQIFSVVPINGPTGALFNIRKQSRIAQIATILCEASVTGSLNDKYWLISSPSVDYYVWYSVGGGGTDPAIAGKTGIPVALTSGAGEVATAVALNTQGALDALDDFNSTVDTATVTVENSVVGEVTPPADGDTTWTDAWTVTTAGGGEDGENEFELIRSEVEVYNSGAIKTGLTQEAVQDLYAMHGKEAEKVIGMLLRGLANDDENTKTLAFLAAQAKAGAGLALTDSGNAQTNLFEIIQNVQQLVLQINSKNLRTYEACVVLPYQVASSIMGLTKYGGDSDNAHGLFIGQLNQTKYFTHPDATKLDAYVVLKDIDNHSKSSAVFSPYTANVIEATDPDDGSKTFHIFNRYAITASPLHVTDNEMIYSFAITL